MSGAGIIDSLHGELPARLQTPPRDVCFEFQLSQSFWKERLDSYWNKKYLYSLFSWLIKDHLPVSKVCTAMTNDNAPTAAAREDYAFLIENDYFLLCFSPRSLTEHFSSFPSFGPSNASLHPRLPRCLLARRTHWGRCLRRRRWPAIPLVRLPTAWL